MALSVMETECSEKFTKEENKRTASLQNENESIIAENIRTHEKKKSSASFRWL